MHEAYLRLVGGANGNKTQEPDETSFVNLSNASGATIEDGQGLGMILNDDFSRTGGKHTSSASAIDAALDDLLNTADEAKGLSRASKSNLASRFPPTNPLML